jgi:hypothetical protein
MEWVNVVSTITAENRYCTTGYWRGARRTEK